MWKVVGEGYEISTEDFEPIQVNMEKFIEEYYWNKGDRPVEGWTPPDWTPDAEGSLNDAFNRQVEIFKKTGDDLSVAIVFANGFDVYAD